MPRRLILSVTERDTLLALPESQDDLIRYYTFNDSDLSLIRQRRGDANRLGFAVQLCLLRYPGYALGTDNRLGEIRDRSFEQQRYRASGLNLVTAAIVLWNTVYLERATLGLGETGKPVDSELLQYLSPLGWEHINLTGDYVWRQSCRLEGGKFRPLRLPGKP